MKFLDSPSPEELAAEAREALRRLPPQSSREIYTELVRKGWINARGQVTNLLCGIAEPEPNYETWTMEEDAPGSAAKAPKRRSADPADDRPWDRCPFGAHIDEHPRRKPGDGPCDRRQASIPMTQS